MIVSFEHICKNFGSTEVLHDVSLSVSGGQILALLGENGAGKSTLMNILGGLFPPSSGRILLDGVPVKFRSPEDSIRHGIAFIHQELNPVNDLRVYENIYLGRELRGRLGFLKRKAMASRAREILGTMLGTDIDEQAFMRTLGASQKQIVEIARALLCEAKIIIMDEPTTSLAGHEIDMIFNVVRTLRSQGVGIIFISHKLNEVTALCTDMVVLRNGAVVASGPMAGTDAEALSEAIVGHELSQMRRSTPGAYGDVVLACEGLSLPGVFSDVSFQVRSGEILGITGLLGDGRSEVFRCLFGDIRGYKGRVTLCGKPYRGKTPKSAVSHGMAYVPSNRKENAIVPDLSVLNNGTLATLRQYCRWGLVCRRLQHSAFQDMGGDFHIKYHREDDMITTLSGGNQQKVILTRWLNAHPRVLILDNPTQGVDIGAKQEIYDIIRKIAGEGVAVVVLSGEGQEILRLCERALVMVHGRIAGELSGDALTESAIMALATGARNGAIA